MYIPFNEVSIHEDFISNVDEFKIAEIIAEFEKLISEIKKKGIIDKFLSKDDFSGEIKKLLENKYITGVRKSFFITFFSKDIIRINPDNCVDDFTITIDERKYHSLGCAYASRDDFQTIVISVPSNVVWQKDSLNGIYTCCNDIEEFENKSISLKQISNENQISILSSIVSVNNKHNISSGQDLWERRESLYPNLIFLDDVKKQLYGNLSKYDIDRIMINLEILQNYFEKLERSFNLIDLSNYGINISPESPSVDNNEKRRRERTFVLPNGISKYFSLHIKFNTIFAGATRMYILPLENLNKCYIGYIGKHKPTKKY